jgi:hypothetical protein
MDTAPIILRKNWDQPIDPREEDEGVKLSKGGSQEGAVRSSPDDPTDPSI